MEKKKLGSIIKDFIDRSPFSVNEVAESIGTTPQNLYKLFKKESLDTKYLEDISRVIGIPVSNLFNEMFNTTNISNADENNLLIKLKNENESLKKRISELAEQLEDKKMIIDFLKERKAVSGHDIATPIEDRHKTYIDPNDIDAWLKHIDNQPFDYTNEAEKWEYIENEIAKRKKNKRV